MNPQGLDLLSQLRDIHAPPPAPWWPPAPGWWVLAALLLAGLFVLVRGVWRAWRRRRRRRGLLHWVDRIERESDPARVPAEFIARINRALKWVAIRAFPDQGCAALQGRKWTGFLAQGLPDEAHKTALESLADGPYEPHPEFDPAAVTRAAREWIRRHG